MAPQYQFETDEHNGYFLATLNIHPAFIKPDANEQKVMAFCSTPKSSREILEYLGKTYHSYNLKKFIQPLVDKYCLIPTATSEQNSNRKFISREVAQTKH